MSDFARFPTRRRLLATGAFAASGFVFANDAFAQDLSPTPSCHDALWDARWSFLAWC
jgi:hypothetical protein